jgi:hypothetical protein
MRRSIIFSPHVSTQLLSGQQAVSRQLRNYELVNIAIVNNQITISALPVIRQQL